MGLFPEPGIPGDKRPMGVLVASVRVPWEDVAALCPADKSHQQRGQIQRDNSVTQNVI